MKNTFFLPLLMLVLVVKGFSQIEFNTKNTIGANNIQSDSINLSPNKDFEKRIRLTPIEKSKNQIEIRFYELEGLSNTRNLIVLKLKNNSWTATKFSESNYPKINIEKFALKAPKGFSEVVQKLYQNNLTQLPNLEELKPKMKRLGNFDPKRGQAEEVIFVNDGEFYTIEFKIGYKWRIFSFNNPEVYLDFYSNVQELKNFVAIKNTFNNELKRK